MTVDEIEEWMDKQEAPVRITKEYAEILADWYNSISGSPIKVVATDIKHLKWKGSKIIVCQ
jgi:hypothetical protein